MSASISWAVTGHQPPLLGGFTPEVDERLLALARGWISRSGPGCVVSGMVAGWDMAVATAAVEADVPLIAALAWPGQGADWPDEAQTAYRKLLDAAVQVHVHALSRAPGMWSARDRWVLGQASAVVALWSGCKGGTGQAVAHAHAVGLPVENLWNEWNAMSVAASVQGGLDAECPDC